MGTSVGAGAGAGGTGGAATCGSCTPIRWINPRICKSYHTKWNGKYEKQIRKAAKALLSFVSQYEKKNQTISRNENKSQINTKHK